MSSLHVCGIPEVKTGVNCIDSGSGDYANVQGLGLNNGEISLYDVREKCTLSSKSLVSCGEFVSALKFADTGATVRVDEKSNYRGLSVKVYNSKVAEMNTMNTILNSSAHHQYACVDDSVCVFDLRNMNVPLYSASLPGEGNSIDLFGDKLVVGTDEGTVHEFQRLTFKPTNMGVNCASIVMSARYLGTGGVLTASMDEHIRVLNSKLRGVTKYHLSSFLPVGFNAPHATCIQQVGQQVLAGNGAGDVGCFNIVDTKNRLEISEYAHLHDYSIADIHCAKWTYPSHTEYYMQQDGSLGKSIQKTALLATAGIDKRLHVFSNITDMMANTACLTTELPEKPNCITSMQQHQSFFLGTEGKQKLLRVDVV